MAFSKVKTESIADSGVTTAKIANDAVVASKVDDDGTGFTVGNLTNSGTLQQTGQVTLGSGGTNWTLPTARGTDKYVLQINGTTGASTWAESLVAPEISSHNFDVSGSTDDGGINAYEAPYEYTGTTTNASTTISSLSSTTGLLAGQYISGAGIPADTTIVSVNTGASTMVISNQATAAASGVALKIQKTPGEKNGGKVILTGTNFGVNVADISVAITTSNGGVIANASYLSALSATSVTAEWTGTEGSYSTDLTSSYDGKIYFKMTKSGLASNVYDTNTTLTTDATLTTLSTSSQTGGERAVAPSETSLGTYGSGQVAGGGNERETRLLLNFDRFGGKDVEDSSNAGGDGHKVVSTNAVIKGSPFGDGKTGMYFDGSDDRVAIPNHADFTVGGTNPWSIDFWVCPDLSDYGGFISITDVGANDVSNSQTALTVYMDNSSPKQLFVYLDDNNSGWSIMGSSNVGFPFNHDLRWHHIAVTYGGNPADEVYRVYVDGVLYKATTSSSQMYSSSGNQGLILGCNDSGVAHFKGYLDEVRWVVGENPFPVGGFTPSQYRYGTAGATHEVSTASNMKLLIHSEQEEDSSDLKNIITKYGTVIPNTGTTAYTGGNGAWKFDGNSDYLKTPFSSEFDFGTGDFTIEGHFRKTGTAATQVLIAKHGRTAGNDSEWYLRFQSSGNELNFYVGDADHAYTHGLSNSGVDVWVHLAVVRISGTTKIYQDGVEKTSFSDNENYDSGEYITIGVRNSSTNNFTQYFEGRAQDIRVTKGLGIYTGAFTKPSGPLTTTWTQTGSGTPTSNGGYTSLTNVATNSDSSKVKLLLLGDGAKFADSATTGTTHTPVATGSYHTQTHGGIAPALAWPASGATTGTSGVYFTTADQKLTISTPSGGGVNAAFAGTGSWFWEGWIYYIYQGSNAFRVFFSSRSSNVVTALVLAIDEPNDQLDILMGGGGAWHIDAYVNGLNARTVLGNKWNHLLVQRHGANIDVYLNGIKKTLAGNDSTLASGNSLDSGTTMTLGDDDAGNASFYGYLDNVRIGTGTPTTDSTDPLFTNGQTSTSSNNYVNGLPTKVYGAFGSEKPDVGTITLTATGSGDYTWSEMSQGTALPGTLAVGSTTHSGSGDSRTHTATITGAFTSGVTSDTTTNGILLKAQNDTDATKAITLGSSGGYDGIGITQKSTGRPTMFNGRRYHGIPNTTKSITGYGFAPDLIWVKSRTSAWHQMHDTVRGTSGSGAGVLYPNDANVAETGSAIQSFDSDGFTLHSSRSNSINSDNGIIAWGFKAGGAPSAYGKKKINGDESDLGSNDYNNLHAVDDTSHGMKQSINTTGGFSITKFSLGATSGYGWFKHGFSGDPDWVIIRRLDATYNWDTWHSGLTTSWNANQTLRLNTAESLQSGRGNIFRDSSTTGFPKGDGKIYIDKGAIHGGDADDEFICYAWKAVAGVSAFGTYTGNGAGGGVRQYTTTSGNAASGSDTGFRPRWIMSKSSNSTSAFASWTIIDGFRSDFGTSGTKTLAASETLPLYADLGKQEGQRSNNTNTSVVQAHIYDDGFQLYGDCSEVNASDNYVWIAFA